MSMKLNLDIYREVNEVFRRLNNMHRWTSMVTENKYNELAKQALNSLCSYIIASYCEEKGQEIHWERFPKIALYRAFNKAYVSYEIPEAIIEKICKIGNISKNVFNIATREKITDRTNHEFMQFISNECNTLEYRIFRASTKIATYIELLEQEMWTKKHEEIDMKMKEVKGYLEQFSDIEAVKELLEEGNPVFKIIQKIAMLRNSNRWAVNPYITDCSVLGHLFDTAVFAYFIALEEFPNNEQLATKFYFMGIFHDVAETWTTDWPSDVKDRITGLREAVEVFEGIMLDENLYKVIPPFLAEKIKNVMYEEGDNLEYKTLLKGADYLSADSECWRQYVAGSREPYFLASAIRGFDNQLITGYKARLTPIAKELHVEMMHYSERVMECYMGK